MCHKYVLYFEYYNMLFWAEMYLVRGTPVSDKDTTVQDVNETKLKYV